TLGSITAGCGTGEGATPVVASGEVPPAQATEVLSGTQLVFAHSGGRIGLLSDETARFNLSAGSYLVEWSLADDGDSSHEGKSNASITLHGIERSNEGELNLVRQDIYPGEHFTGVYRLVN